MKTISGIAARDLLGKIRRTYYGVTNPAKGFFIDLPIERSLKEYPRVVGQDARLTKNQ